MVEPLLVYGLFVIVAQRTETALFRLRLFKCCPLPSSPMAGPQGAEGR